MIDWDKIINYLYMVIIIFILCYCADRISRVNDILNLNGDCILINDNYYCKNGD